MSNTCIDHYINALDTNAREINTTLSVTISQQDYSQQKKQKNKKGSSTQSEQVTFQIPVQHANDFIDPNEPVYCFCRQVSFGRMIGCESDSCKYEWFHFECVGLKEEPDVWYCSECQAEFDASSGMRNESERVMEMGKTSNDMKMESAETDKEAPSNDNGEAPLSPEIDLGTHENDHSNDYENSGSILMDMQEVEAR